MSHEDQHIIIGLIDLCRQQEVKCLVQVGAEDGYEADKIRAATGARVIAIEGDTRCAPCAPDLEYHYALIGATDCATAFYITGSIGLSGHFLRNDGQAQTRVELPQRRLDTFCAQHAIEPDALIIDTEGTTLEVLEGCGELLDRVKLIYAECQGSVIREGVRLIGEVDTFLAARGFTQHQGIPSYGVGASQGNYTWVK